MQNIQTKSKHEEEDNPRLNSLNNSGHYKTKTSNLESIFDNARLKIEIICLTLPKTTINTASIH